MAHACTPPISLLLSLLLLAASPSAHADLLATSYANALLLPAAAPDNNSSSPCTRIVAGTPFALSGGGLPAACGSPALMSVRLDGRFRPGFLRVGGTYSVAVQANTGVRFWIRGWKMTDAWQQPDNDTTATLHAPAWNFTVTADLNLTVRLELLVYGGRTPAVTLLWKQAGDSAAAYRPLPDTALQAVVSADEVGFGLFVIAASVPRTTIPNARPLRIAKPTPRYLAVWKGHYATSSQAHTTFPSAVGRTLCLHCQANTTLHSAVEGTRCHLIV